MADDDGRRARADGGGAVEDVLDHRLPGDAVQHFGQRGLHPRALAGGENDDVSVH